MNNRTVVALAIAVLIVAATLVMLWTDEPGKNLSQTSTDKIEPTLTAEHFEPPAELSRTDRPAVAPPKTAAEIPSDPALQREMFKQEFPSTYFDCLWTGRNVAVFKFDKPSHATGVEHAASMIIGKKNHLFFAGGAPGLAYGVLPGKKDGDYTSYPLLSVPFPKGKELEVYRKLDPQLDGAFILNRDSPSKSKVNIRGRTRGEEPMSCELRPMQDLRPETAGMTKDEMFDFYEKERAEWKKWYASEMQAAAEEKRENARIDAERRKAIEASGVRTLPGGRVVGSYRRDSPAIVTQEEEQALVELYKSDPEGFKAAMARRQQEIDAYHRDGQRRSEENRKRLREAALIPDDDDKGATDDAADGE